MDHKNKIKGFTLTELIIVIAIIGILVAILGPTMTSYFRRSRIKSANADAKMVYNAAQTAAQNFMAEDRARADSAKSPLASTLIVVYENNGAVKYGLTYDNYANLTEIPAASLTPEQQDVAAVAAYINKTVSDGSDCNWCVAIEGYMVKGAVSANSLTSDLVGYYTANRTQASGRSANTYQNWFNAAGGAETIKGLSGTYDISTPRPLEEETTEPTT